MSDNLKITVSGVRAVVGDTLTTELTSGFGKAFGTYLKSGSVVVGTDSRTSNEMVKTAVMTGLLATGCDVIDIGIAPTPTVLLATKKYKAKGGVVVTASHNPSEWNGLKFADESGSCLNETEVKKLIAIYRRKAFKEVPWSQIGTSRCREDAVELHINQVARHIDVNLIRRRGLRVAVDTCNGAACVISRKFLERLGCRVWILNETADGRFAHDPEPTSKNLSGLSEFVKKKKADIGFAQDPDADRLAIVSEKGKAIGEENTLALALKHLLSKRRKSVVTVNLSTSRMIDDICGLAGAKLFRSRIGEANVVDMMRKNKSVIGGEGNGGLIYPKINFCRDSIAAMGVILEYLASSGNRVSDLVSGVKQYAMIKKKMNCSEKDIDKVLLKIKKAFSYSNKINTLDGVKVEWADKWLHARRSNTEPIVRIMIEAETVFEAEDVYNMAKNSLGPLWG